MWVFTVPIPLCNKLDGPLIGPWLTPLIVFLLGLDAIGKEIEDPFGDDYNDIPVEEFQKTLLADSNYITYNKFEDDHDVIRLTNTIPVSEAVLKDTASAFTGIVK